MRNDIDIEKQKSRLLEEKTELEKGLASVGRINPDNPADWEPTPSPDAEHDADENTEADNVEEFEERTAVLKDLEERYNNVQEALQNIENGTYGICKVSGEEIERQRLEANPAALTCTAHMNQ